MLLPRTRRLASSEILPYACCPRRTPACAGQLLRRVGREAPTPSYGATIQCDDWALQPKGVAVLTANDLSAIYGENRKKSSEYFERAARVLAGKVGHDLRHFEPLPLYIERGSGGRKWDVDGNEYVDFLMGNGALLLGHAPPEVVEAISQTVGRGTHFGSDHRLHIEWAELVQELVPSAERVRFVNSGTEATLLALRLARAFTGRNKILRFEGHFHGWHDDVVHGFHPPFDADGSLGVPPQVRENMVVFPDGNLNLVEDLLSRDSDICPYPSCKLSRFTARVRP